MLKNSGVIGIGTDLLDQSRIANIVEKHGERFPKRILTPQEFLLWVKKDHSINFLAKRFAAKEAISKALGTGIAQGISFQHINIHSNADGKPEVVLSSVALSKAQQLGGEQVLLSLSDEGEMILAFALLT
jgi:holo-[acyl-carrier protein] synthase